MHADLHFGPEYHTLANWWRVVEHILEVEIVGCIADMILSLEHDGFYSLKWVWDPGLYCFCLRARGEAL